MKNEKFSNTTACSDPIFSIGDVIFYSHDGAAKGKPPTVIVSIKGHNPTFRKGEKLLAYAVNMDGRADGFSLLVVLGDSDIEGYFVAVNKMTNKASKFKKSGDMADAVPKEMVFHVASFEMEGDK